MLPDAVDALRLKTLDINLVAPYQRTQIRACGDPPDLPKESGKNYVLHPNAAAACNELLKALSALPQRAPQLQRLQVIDAMDQDDTGSLSCISRFDVLANKTITCPIEQLDKNMCEMRLPAYPMLDYTPPDYPPDVGDKESAQSTLESQESVSYCAPQHLLDEVVERHPWKQTIEGYRFPAELVKPKHIITERACMTQEDVKEKYAIETDLWQREAAAGRQLMRPRVVGGLDPVKPIYKEPWKYEWEKEREAEANDDEEEEWWHYRGED